MGRKTSRNKKGFKFTPAVLDELLHTIAEGELQNLPVVEIGAKAGIHRTQVWKLRKTPRYQEVLEKMRGQIADYRNHVELKTIAAKLEHGTHKALDKVIELVDSPQVPASIQLRASQDLLDRNEQTSKKRTVSAKITHEILPGEQLKAMFDTMKVLAERRSKSALPAASSEGPVIDIDVHDASQEAGV